MAKEQSLPGAETPSANPDGQVSSTYRKIPGNLPYLTASGTFKKILDKLIEAQRPDKFNADYLENVLKFTGGGARATIPILKKMGFLATDGSPTEIYGRFRTDGGRGGAALQGLRNAFGELFKRSDYAHAADDGKLRDLLVEITGLKGNDPVVGAIRNTFNAVRSFVPSNIDLGSSQPYNSADLSGQNFEEPFVPRGPNSQSDEPAPHRDIRLAYNINIVLPETSDLNVLNAIFRSLKENLMK